MSDELSAPSRSGFPALLAGLIGMGIGAVVTGAIFGALMLRQQTRHEAQLAAAAAATANVPDFGFNRQVPVFDMTGGEEAKVKKFGTEFIEDLESNRLQSAYRSMSPDYQMKNKREAFDKLMAENPAVRRLESYGRVEKVRKGIAADSYEFYLTATERLTDTNRNKVNFAVTIVKMNDEWRVSELEIDADSKPTKK